MSAQNGHFGMHSHSSLTTLVSDFIFHNIHLQSHPWVSLRDTGTFVQVQPAAKRVNARLEFSFVYPDKRGRNVMRNVSLADTRNVAVATLCCCRVVFAHHIAFIKPAMYMLIAGLPEACFSLCVP